MFGIFKKCFHCKSHKDVKKVDVLSWVEFITVYYHDGCLREVLCNPEKYSNRQIGKAQDIVKTIKQDKQYREDKIKAAKKMCNELENI